MKVKTEFKRIIVNIFTYFKEPKEDTNNYWNEFRELEYTNWSPQNHKSCTKWDNWDMKMNSIAVETLKKTQTEIKKEVKNSISLTESSMETPTILMK